MRTPDPRQRRSYVSRATVLVSMVGVLLLGVTGALAWDAADRTREERAAREFQTLVRGVGLGPRVDLSGCAFAFDPRISGVCTGGRGLLPMGSAYCPEHSLSILPYRELTAKISDAHVP